MGKCQEFCGLFFLFSGVRKGWEGNNWCLITSDDSVASGAKFLAKKWDTLQLCSLGKLRKKSGI